MNVMYVAPIGTVYGRLDVFEEDLGRSMSLINYSTRPGSNCAQILHQMLLILKKSKRCRCNLDLINSYFCYFRRIGPCIKEMVAEMYLQV
jgi:hypothetical protein